MDIGFAPLQPVQQGQSFKEKALKCMRHGAAITTLACTIIGGAALVQYSLGIWAISTAASTAYTFFSMRDLLREGESRFSRTMLLVSLIGTGSLLFGGSLGVTYFFGQFLSLDVELFLFQGLVITWALGYLMPFGMTLLKGGYTGLTDPNWKDKINTIGILQKGLPHIRWGFEQFERRYNLLYTLCRPQEMAQWQQNFQVELPLEVGILLAILSNQSKLETFKTSIKLMKGMSANLDIMPGDMMEIKTKFLKQAKTILENDLTGDDHKAAIQFLLSHANELGLTKDQFTELFQTKCLEEVKTQAQLFIDASLQLNSINEECVKLEIELNEIEKDIKEKGDALKDRLKTVTETFHALRAKLEKYEKEKKQWVTFIDCPNSYLQALPDMQETIANLKIVLKADMQEKFKSLYQASMGADPNARTGIGGILFKINAISAKLNDASSEEQESAWMFLATNCEFKQDDFTQLRDWLKVNEYHEIEEKLEKLGLKDKEDLYKHKILPKEGRIPKETIKANLQKFIQQMDSSGDIRTRVYSALSSLKNQKLSNLTIKVSQLVYRLITMGMILVPVFMYPIVSGIGFGAGTCYAILQKFSAETCEGLDDLLSDLTSFSHQIRNAMRLISGRRFFSMTPSASENMNTFVRADFFARMRLLNWEFLMTAGIAFATITEGGSYNNEPLGIGGFLQGIALGRETVGLFTGIS